VPLTLYPAYRRQYCVCRCLQPHAFSFLCLQWPVSLLPLPTATSLLLPLFTVTRITSTVAYSYKPSPSTVHSDQNHFCCCLQLQALSSHCPQWPLSTLPLPTATFLLFPLCTVASVTFVVSYSYMPSPSNAQRSLSTLLLPTATCVLSLYLQPPMSFFH